MSMQFEKDDTIRIHAKGTIAQLCAVFRSHEQGLPEWLKNSNTAYVNVNAPSQERVITILFGTKSSARYVAVLDHVGMTVEDIEKKIQRLGKS